MSIGNNEKLHAFEHPGFQVLMLFVSQSLSLPLYLCTYRPSKPTSTFVTVQPQSVTGDVPWRWYVGLAICHVISSAFLLSGLVLIYASVAQMLRGAAILFTASLSILLFRTRFTPAHWCGMILVTSGLLLVGWDATRSVTHPQGNRSPFAGIICILAAEATGAMGLIIQQAMYRRWTSLSPLQVAGWEGVIGLFLCMSIIGAAYGYAPAYMFNSVTDLTLQLQNSTRAQVIVIINAISVATYKWSGTAIIQALSAPHLTVLNCIRTLVIWIFSLLIGWQTFRWMQLIGFIILVLGTFLFNGVILLSWLPHEDLHPHHHPSKQQQVIIISPSMETSNETNPLLHSNSKMACSLAATSYDAIQ